MTLDELKIGDRVQLHPATDLWMRGARYGRVYYKSRKLVSVELDCGIVASLHPRDILEIVEA